LLGGFASNTDSPAMVMVTHHVEEIPPGFTHALLLAEGEVHAEGPISEVLTSENLSGTFGLPIELEERDGRFTARAAR
jgi:iron complex transport system ATP-binding protein